MISAEIFCAYFIDIIFIKGILYLSNERRSAICAPTMAGKKISCSKCRRSYDNKIEFCPYCGSPNPLFAKATPVAADKPIKSATVKKQVSKKPVPEPEPEIDEYDVSDEFDTTQGEYLPDEYLPDEDDGEEAVEDEGAFYPEENADEGSFDSDDDEDDEEYDEDNGEYGNDEANEDEEEPEFSESYDDLDSEEASHSVLTNNTKRERIEWTDEEPVDASNNEDMYDENGKYNPNYDHFYDDTKAKIQNELESLASGKEKAILKIVGGVVAVIAVIVYLILTLY